MLRFNRLHNRIMLPFMALFLVINLAPLLLNRYYIGRLIDQRIAVQTDRISHLVSSSGFVLNPAYLARLRNVIDSDIIVFNRTCEIAASTMKHKPRMDLLAKRPAQGVWAALEDGGTLLFQEIVPIENHTFMLTARLLGEESGVHNRLMLWVISPMSDARDAKSSLAVQMGLVSLAGIAVMFIFGHLIARSVTRPVSNLVTVTQEVAAGRFEQKALLPSVRELRRLASSINMMSDKLAGFEKQVAMSSRLAAAGKVTAAMSHEIRNPLSSIKMLAQLLRNKPGIAPEDRHIIHAMLEEIVRVERIVADSSGLLRPSKFDKKPIHVNELIEDILPVITPKLNHRKVRLTFHPKTDIPKIPMDKDKVKQVIWNLLLNAMESMPHGGEIKINAWVEEEGGKLHISVEDEGCGLVDSHVEDVFTPFYSTKPEGLGLGLSTSKEIMNGHAGNLILENREERGVRATMTFSLPETG